jgi:hypothetical protein
MSEIPTLRGQVRDIELVLYAIADEAAYPDISKLGSIVKDDETGEIKTLQAADEAGPLDASWIITAISTLSLVASCAVLTNNKIKSAAGLGSSALHVFEEWPVVPLRLGRRVKILNSNMAHASMTATPRNGEDEPVPHSHYFHRINFVLDNYADYRTKFVMDNYTPPHLS